MSNTIQLNLINQSNEVNTSEVVIFQKNVATSFDELAVAWRVINNLGQSESHPFAFSYDMTVNAEDGDSSDTAPVSASSGESFQMAQSQAGNRFSPKGKARNTAEVQVQNNLAQGNIDAKVHRDGKLLASKKSIAPGQEVAFEFKPSIWVGVTPGTVEGAEMSSNEVASASTELSLSGVASADIIMTGGGPGSASTPFVFTLENVVMA